MKKLLLAAVVFFFTSSNSFSQNVQITERLSGKLKSLNPIEYMRNEYNNND